MRILHTMLRVGNLQRSIDYYTQVLGMQLLRTSDNPEYQYTLAFLGFESNPHQAELELTYNYGHGPYDLGDGYGHLAISVPDLEASWQRHHDMGLDLRPLSGIDEGKKNFYFMQDPDGYKIEVMRAK